MLLILKVLELKIFQKKSKYLLLIKTSQQIFLEYKHIIQSCVHIFVLDLLILCLKTKALLIFPRQIIFWKNDDIILKYFKNRY